MVQEDTAPCIRGKNKIYRKTLRLSLFSLIVTIASRGVHLSNSHNRSDVNPKPLNPFGRCPRGTATGRANDPSSSLEPESCYSTACLGFRVSGS